MSGPAHNTLFLPSFPFPSSPFPLPLLPPLPLPLLLPPSSPSSPFPLTLLPPLPLPLLPPSSPSSPSFPPLLSLSSRYLSSLLPPSTFHPTQHIGTFIFSTSTAASILCSSTLPNCTVKVCSCFSRPSLTFTNS